MPLSPNPFSSTIGVGFAATCAISARDSAVCTTLMTRLGAIVVRDLNSTSRRHGIRWSPRRASTVTLPARSGRWG